METYFFFFFLNSSITAKYNVNQLGFFNSEDWMLLLFLCKQDCNNRKGQKGSVSYLDFTNSQWEYYLNKSVPAIL